MGGIFGVTSRRNCIIDVFFGTDYHSHLGTRRGGMAAYDPVIGLQRDIHNIENSPFRTRFEHVAEEMTGCAAIGCISDTDPQPLLIRSNLGQYAIGTIGVINNADELTNQYLSFSGGHFDAMTGGKVNSNELIAAMIDQKSSFVDGIRFAQKVIKGTATILILRDGGHLIAARDRLGRLPLSIGRNEDGYCVAFEPFSYTKLGYEMVRELGPGEIVELSPDGIEGTLAVNYAAPYLLTRMLLPQMEQGAHIVNMVSLTSKLSSIDKDILHMPEQSFSQLGTYGKTKLALLLFTAELDRRIAEKRIWPAIDVFKSGTRKEERLLSLLEQNAAWNFRRGSQNETETGIMENLLKDEK